MLQTGLKLRIKQLEQTDGYYMEMIPKTSLGINLADK